MRSFARQSPAIVISLIALTFSLGSGAGWAASDVTTHPAKAAPKPTWHALSLKNQWKAAAKGYGAARPQYTIVNDVVFLDGAASRANQTLPLTQVIGYLPKGARPSHVLFFAAANYALNGESSIYVFPNGAIEVLGNGGDENYFSSLDGIEFPLGS
jgi:hypothetical protein